MIYFCADDYGIAKEGNNRIEECFSGKLLNKVSVLPNGEIESFKERLGANAPKLALHLNLVEGYPLSKREDVDLILANDGSFKYSFIGLFLLSLSPKRKQIEKQIYTEIESQIKFWKNNFGDEPMFIDSHQHTHMIPLVFKTLMRVIADQKVEVGYMRFPSEPTLPYLLTPALYSSYTLSGIVKHCLLKFLGFINQKELKKSKIKTGYFMGIMFSGRVDQKPLEKILPKYIRLSKKYNTDIEIGFHPGYLKKGEERMSGCRNDFEKFYYSPWRKTEYDTLMNFKEMKEG